MHVYPFVAEENHLEQLRDVRIFQSSWKVFSLCKHSLAQLRDLKQKKILNSNFGNALNCLYNIKKWSNPLMGFHDVFTVRVVFTIVFCIARWISNGKLLSSHIHNLKEHFISSYLLQHSHRQCSPRILFSPRYQPSWDSHECLAELWRLVCRAPRDAVPTKLVQLGQSTSPLAWFRKAF